MSPRTIRLAALAALGLGLWLAGRATLRIRELERTSASLAQAGREAGASFEQTLQGEHAARQFRAFDERRAVVLERATARRDRLFAVLLCAAGLLGLAAASAFARIAREIEEARRPAGAEPGEAHPPPGTPG
jgi:hypothetical protein